MGKRKLLILGLVWPEPNATAAGVRMMQLINTFLNADWELTFATTATKTEITADLQALGITSQSISVNDDTFDSFVEALQPDIVLFDRFIMEEQFGWRVAEKAPQALRVLDTEDLHSLRLARQQAVKQDKPFEINDWISLEQTKRELASIYRCDLSLIISRKEEDLLKQVLNVPSELLLYLPIWIEQDQISTKTPSYDSRKGFIFIGNGKHLPNVDAIQFLKDGIWPIIRNRMPEAQLHIYGAYLPERISNLHAPSEGFHVRGYIENADSAMQKARVNLASLRFGAGLKGKLLLAMQNGTPSITTAMGAEGLFDALSMPEVIADDPEEFAHKAVQVHQDKSLWEQLQQMGFDILKNEFDSSYFQEHCLSIINHTLEQLEAHRSKNFIGAMLQHHSLQSTKYLSRWISCKNQLKSLQEGE